MINFRTIIEQEIASISQSFKQMADELTKYLYEKRDSYIRKINLLHEVYQDSYNHFSYKFETLFKSEDKLKILKDINEAKIKRILRDIKATDDYKTIIDKVRECTEAVEELKLGPKRIEELMLLMDSLSILGNISNPSYQVRKEAQDRCTLIMKKTIDQAFDINNA